MEIINNQKFRQNLKKWEIYRNQRNKAIDKYAFLVKKRRLVLTLIAKIMIQTIMNKYMETYTKVLEMRKSQMKKQLMSVWFYVKYKAVICGKWYCNDYDVR